MSRMVHVFSSLEELHRSAAHAIVHEAQKAVAARGLFSLVLSGGSTPKAVYEQLAGEMTHSHVTWENVHVFWGDERCVPPDHAESNYRMVHETLLRRITIPPTNIHRIEAELPPKDAAERYEKELRLFFMLKEKEFPRFDLILLGLGEDGHIASLFPGTPILTETKRLVAETFVPKLKANRISMTLPTINNARALMFLVAGASKAKILYEVLETTSDHYPAQRVQPTDGLLLWFVDADAAAFLSPDTVHQQAAPTS